MSDDNYEFIGIMSDNGDEWLDGLHTAEPIPPNESTGAWQAMITEHVLDYERAARTSLMLMVTALHYRDLLRCDIGMAIDQVARMNPADLVISMHDLMNTLLIDTNEKRGRR